MLHYRALLLLALSLLSLSGSAQADDHWLPDLRLGLLGRTHPGGVQFVGQAGVSTPLWGETDTWKYGYARLATNFATSAVINRVGIEVQVFPISILGFSAGYDTEARAYLPNYIDCNTLECIGRVDRKFLKAVMVGAYKKVVFSMLGRYEEVRSYFGDQPLFYDEVTLLAGKSGGEHFLTLNPALLYTLTSEYKVGFTTLYARAIDTGGSSNLYGPIVSFAKGRNWSGVVGGGLNSSSYVHSAITGFMSIQYLIAPSLNVAEMGLRDKKFTPVFSEDQKQTSGN